MNKWNFILALNTNKIIRQVNSKNKVTLDVVERELWMYFTHPAPNWVRNQKWVPAERNPGNPNVPASLQVVPKLRTDRTPYGLRKPGCSLVIWLAWPAWLWQGKIYQKTKNKDMIWSSGDPRQKKAKKASSKTLREREGERIQRVSLTSFTTCALCTELYY